MKQSTGVAAKMFAALADEKVNIQNISTSEIRISCIVAKEDAEKSLKAVHAAFELDKEQSATLMCEDIGIKRMKW